MGIIRVVDKRSDIACTSYRCSIGKRYATIRKHIIRCCALAALATQAQVATCAAKGNFADARRKLRPFSIAHSIFEVFPSSQRKATKIHSEHLLTRCREEG